MSAPSPFKVNSPVANATVGKNVTIKGQIVSREDLTIEGEFEGTIEIGEHRLAVASEGKVRADVKAREVEVIGSMHGKVEAVEKVYVRNGASVVGDIHSAGIIIEDGAYIKGGIDLTRPTGRAASQSHRPTETKSEIVDLSEAVSRS